MHRLILVFVALLVASLIYSCKESESNNSLLGTWEETSFVVTECQNPDFNNSEICSSACQKLTFSDSTVVFDNDAPINYAVDGNVITIVLAGTTLFPVYNISGNMLTITIQDREEDGGCKSVYTYERV